MLPELLRFSSRSRLLEKIPEELKAVHRTRDSGPHTTRPAHTTEPQELMDGWITNTTGFTEAEGEEEEGCDDEEDELDDLDDSVLASLGL